MDLYTSVKYGLLLVLLLFIQLARPDCFSTCRRGICNNNVCECQEGFTGTDCTQEFCGENMVCTANANCINKECCTNDPLAPKCSSPLPYANPAANEKSSGGLPPAAIVGIICIVLVVAAVGTAFGLAKYRGAGFPSLSTAKANAKNKTDSEKPDGISTFKPAEDVTSIDYVEDVTGQWTRTESNAGNEAPGVMVPYTNPSGITVEKTLAWEESERKLVVHPEIPVENKSKSSAASDARGSIAARNDSVTPEPTKSQTTRRKTGPKKRKV